MTKRSTALSRIRGHARSLNAPLAGANVGELIEAAIGTR
jgi:hypothetical protein